MTVGGAGPRSRSLFRTARGVLPGGVDSPVRSFAAVGGTPVFFREGRGAYLTDVDGRRYLDLVGSWGANLLGNAPTTVVAAVRRAAGAGLSFGAPSPLEHAFAAEIRRAVPVLERLRFVSSGTEATMSAIRVARGATGRSRIIMVAGGYHGHSDALLARAGSGVGTQSLPGSAGVPPSVVRDTAVVPYNDLEAVRATFDADPEGIAAVIVEPVAANMGLVPPAPGFLPGLERAAHRSGALLIADEVITGFRLRRGGAYADLGFRPDLLTLGKVIGGGVPIGAFGGRRELLETVAPLGPVYQAGTLAGNPLAMAAGRAVLDALTPARYTRLERTSARLERELVTLAGEEGVEEVAVQRVGSLLGVFFAPRPVTDFATAQRSDRRRYAAYFHAALRGGVYLPPSPLETAFVSMATTPADLAAAAPALRGALRAAGRRTAS